jgi:hypothetical protein
MRFGIAGSQKTAFNAALHLACRAKKVPPNSFEILWNFF